MRKREGERVFGLRTCEEKEREREKERGGGERGGRGELK